MGQDVVRALGRPHHPVAPSGDERATVLARDGQTRTDNASTAPTGKVFSHHEVIEAERDDLVRGELIETQVRASPRGIVVITITEPPT